MKHSQQSLVLYAIVTRMGFSFLTYLYVKHIYRAQCLRIAKCTSIRTLYVVPVGTCAYWLQSQCSMLTVLVILSLNKLIVVVTRTPQKHGVILKVTTPPIFDAAVVHKNWLLQKTPPGIPQPSFIIMIYFCFVSDEKWFGPNLTETAEMNFQNKLP